MHYRIYLFNPRPFLGERIAVAATLHLPSERRFYLAPRLPSEPFLSPGATSLLRICLRRIENTPDERELHKSLGPHLHTKSQALTLPDGADLDAWMLRMFDD